MVIEFHRRGCQNNNRLSKSTLLAMFPSALDDNGVETLNPRKFFAEMDIADWSIISFNPRNREVCVLIQGKRTVAVILPRLSFSTE